MTRIVVALALLLSCLVPRPAVAHGEEADAYREHTVYTGQRLGSIAKRYNVSIDAICNANGIKRNDTIRPGQKLLIPDRNDKDGSQARLFRLEGTAGSSAKGSWTKYRKRSQHPGYATLVNHNSKWSGQIMGQGDTPLPEAVRAITGILTTPDSHLSIHPRLIRLLATVSDTFGGKPLQIVSAYRTTSFVSGSRHKTGHAVDLLIPGVPNEALRDFLRTFSNVGVGYYPNSTFVHLDVRERSAYWVDYAGPGEAPRLKPRGNERQAAN